MQQPTLSNPNNSQKKPEQNQSGPKQSPQNNQNGNPDLEIILDSVEKQREEWEIKKDQLFDEVLNSAMASRAEGKDEVAAQILFRFFNSQKRELQNIKSEIPNPNKNNKNNRLSQVRERLDSDLKLLDKLQKELNGESFDIAKAKMDSLPENVLNRNLEELKRIDAEIGKAIKEVLNISTKIEVRKKTGVKLSDTEKATFEQELVYAEANFNSVKNSKEKFDSKYAPTDVSKVVLKSFFESINKKITIVEGGGTKDQSFAYFYNKAKESLEKPVDESPEKFKKIEESLALVNAGFAKIKKEIENRKGKDSKLKDEDRLEIKRMIAENDEKFQAAYSDFVEVCISLNIDITHINESNQTIDFKDRDSDSRIFINPEQDLTPKQELKVFELARSFNYAMGYGYKILDNIDDVKHMTAKEQRENAKGMSDRIRIIDKQISEDVDKLSVGKKLTADQKEGHKVSLDVEMVNLKEAQDELDALEDIEENQPTRKLVESILIRAENRIQELTDKIEKVRVATEKEVMEKLDAAEKAIEKIEENIRDISRKDAEGRNTLKVAKQERKDANSNDQSLGVFRKSMRSLFSPNPSYSNGQTYHNQRNVSDTMADPKIYVKEAKDWIADMSESNDKEIKIKTKLLKKARRMNRRITSAKWRHYMTLDANEKGWYLGDKVGTAIVGKIGDGLDRVFG